MHSPFAYNLITKVIEEKAPFYAFDEIENFRKTLAQRDDTIGRITRRSTPHRHVGRLLFRLVNYFKCETVVHIGGRTGVMSLYPVMASPSRCRCFTLEEQPERMDAARAYVESKGLTNLRVMSGGYEDSLQRLQDEGIKIDMLFVDLPKKDRNASQLIRLARPMLHGRSLLVINHIRSNREMRSLWLNVKQQPQTRVTVDLYRLGIAFFDERLHKQNYKTYFNYGKEQSIYRYRR